MRTAFLLATLLASSSCSVIEQPAGLIPRWTTAWKEVVTHDDRRRLTDWRSGFVNAVAAAKKAGYSAEIAREGALLEPDAALVPASIPNGYYRCRMIRIGAKAESGSPPYVTDIPSECRVRADHGLQRFNKYGGAQRYVGLIFPGDAVRQVFLGTLVLGDETRALQYGQDELRDAAGYFERIGPNRWRLLMPNPHFEAQYEVVELVPTQAGAAAR